MDGEKSTNRKEMVLLVPKRKESSQREERWDEEKENGTERTFGDEEDELNLLESIQEEEEVGRRALERRAIRNIFESKVVGRKQEVMGERKMAKVVSWREGWTPLGKEELGQRKGRSFSSSERWPS